jgi:hypothetical protein|tara:strand:+ start:1315 stop:2589 length:1275 start_codon:yes stop_codon:yes gene_type:complete
MKKIIVRGPLLSASGYGEQSRFALRSLRGHEERFDIYMATTEWGQTGWVHDDTEERRWIDKILAKTIAYIQQGGQFDISLQITIPNEWERMAPINIGYTAGIETTRTAPVWLEKANMMDKIVVVSNHAKNVFESTTYKGTDRNTGEEITLACQTPIEVVNYPVRSSKNLELDLDLEYDFNYLAVAQWGPRKNLENTIKWFIEENFDRKVGLVVKTFVRKSNVMDREYTYKNLQNLISAHPEMECKVYLVHGDLSDDEMHSLYRNPKIKAFVSLTHGEGYGLPLFEAAYTGIPVVAPGWSGQCDFLYAPFESKNKKNKKEKMRPYFAEVEYTIEPVPQSAIWEGVIQADSMWCYPQEGSYKMRLRQVYKNYDKWKSKADYLQKWILDNFTNEIQYGKFANAVYQEEKFEIEDWLNELEKEAVEFD